MKKNRMSRRRKTRQEVYTLWSVMLQSKNWCLVIVTWSRPINMTFPFFSFLSFTPFSPFLQLSLHLFLSVLLQVKWLFSTDTKAVSVRRLTSVTVSPNFFSLNLNKPCGWRIVCTCNWTQLLPYTHSPALYFKSQIPSPFIHELLTINLLYCILCSINLVGHLTFKHNQANMSRLFSKCH